MSLFLCCLASRRAPALPEQTPAPVWPPPHSPPPYSEVDGDFPDSDALSLHSNVAIEAGQFVPRARGRRGRGDISGGGDDLGSGLSRWILFKSWWTGQGRIRLEDGDDAEDEEPLFAPEDAQEPEELPPVELEPAPETEEERAARKAARRARKAAAKHLGLSLAEFEAGGAGMPPDLLIEGMSADALAAYAAEAGTTASGSSEGTRRSRSRKARSEISHDERALSPHLGAMADGASVGSSSSSVSDGKRRSKHRTHDSISTTITSSSGGSGSASASGRKSKSRRRAREERITEEGQLVEHAQELQPGEGPGQWMEDEQGNVFWVPFAAVEGQYEPTDEGGSRDYVL